MRYGPVDLVYIAQVLAQPHLPGDLPLDGSLAINLVRGERSDLCRRETFQMLHEGALDSGVTVEVIDPSPAVAPFVLDAAPCRCSAGGQQGGGRVIESSAWRSR